MEIKKFLATLARIKNDLTTNRPKQAELIAREALALIRLRIQNKGKKANGSDLGDYSTNPLPPFFYYKKSINQSGEKAVQQAQKNGVGLSYKSFRAANNLPTDKVTLTFTGAMWREMAVQIASNTATESKAVIQPRTARSQKVALFNSQRYGNILAISKTERDMLNGANFERVIKTFRKYLTP